MTYLYKQEIFKLLKRKSTVCCLIFLLVQNIAVALISKANPNYVNAREMFVSNFASLSFTVFIMIGAAATIISSEFEYNTIKNIIYQPYSRKTILISKWLTILTYSLVAYALTMLMTLINKFIFFTSDYSLTDKIQNNSRIVWQYWILNNMANFLTLWLLLSLVFLLASVMKKNAIAITMGIIGYFALSIIGTFMFMLIDKWKFLKWNPINFMNYPAQVTATGIIPKLTHLTNNEMLLGTLIYIVLFMSIGLYFFSRKEV